MSANNSLKLIADEQLRDAIISYYTDEHATHLFSLLQDRNIKFHDMVVDAIPLEAHIFILQRDSASFQAWAQQSSNIHSKVLEELKGKEELPLALKNAVRSYLLSLSQLERKAQLNQYIREELRKFLKLSEK